VQVGSAAGLINLITIPVGPQTTVAGEAPPGSCFVRVVAENLCATSTASNEAMITVP
jgi:hypothetical protein